MDLEKHHARSSVIYRPSPEADVPITLQQARYRHIEYLERGPHLLVGPEDDPKILCSLLLGQSDLNMLASRAQGGIRLHFCREENGEINIVVVPVDRDGNLIVSPDPGSGVRPIMNSLSPCPVICPPDFSTTSLNCWDVNGDCMWYDANAHRDDGKKWYRKGDDGQRVYADPPEGAPPA